MKRSFINQSIQWAKGVLDEYGIHLPRFAYWSMRDWEKYKDKTQAIRHLMLGWDVTDYGLGRFDEIGGVLFTARNGDIYDQKAGTPYAEKYIVMKPGQRLPMHMHKIKTEDIVSRCGGAFCIRLNASGGDGKVDDRAPVAYRSDEMEYSVPAGSVVEIENGSSITLTPGLYHSFWAKDAPAVIGEVSSINDDNTDNYFVEDMLRFTEIEEDEPPLCPLCNEYGRF